MRLVFLLLFIITVVAIATQADLTSVALWAAEQQRGFQNHMAGAVHALRAGDPGAYWALLGAAGAYGFVHAVGPGHGKYLIGGVGLGTSVPVTRLLSISLASSLAQSLWAIVLVYGGFSLLEISARQMTGLAQDILAPASYLAIGSIGLVLIWRGISTLWHRRCVSADTKANCGCHSHGPSPDQAAQAGSIREAIVLIASIAIRPCTGAIFLLVIAWQMDIRLAGAAAVAIMGLGTAALTSLVAISSIAARSLAWVSADGAGMMGLAVPVLHALAGVSILWMSILMLGFGPV